MHNLHFFTDYETDLNVKIGISALVGKLSPKDTSHKSGWAFMLCNQLWHAGYKNTTVITDTTTNWADYDIILIEHGMEFNGNFNIFGGANDELYRQINRLFTYHTRMYSLHHHMPCVGSLIEKRLKTGSELFTTLASKIPEAKRICKNIPYVDHIAKTNKLCFGDSHSFSQYTPGYMVNRKDGLTLYGALKRGLDSYIYPWIEDLRIYLGNIDIRHHLMRQKNPQSAVAKLVDDYEKALLNLQEKGIKKIEVVTVLPIENTSRKLPKTGYYKDTPYYGSWHERTQLVNKFNQLLISMCHRNKWDIYQHPNVYLNKLGELDFDVMEKPKSVHIARKYYRWDLVNDCANTNLKNKKTAVNNLF